MLDKAFDYQIAGVVLSSWGRDHADVVVCGDVNSGDVDHVLGEVAGRDVAEQPFKTVRDTRPTRTARLAKAMPIARDWALAAVELEHGDLVIGYLFVARADGGRYKAADRALLEGIAAHAGAAFGRVALFTRIRDDYAKTIAALSATLDAGEHMPSGHSSRVMEYSMMIGEELGLPFEDVEQLRFAGLLHDIGKTGLALRPAAQALEALRRGAAARSRARRTRREHRRPDRVPQVADARHPAPPRALGRVGLSEGPEGRGDPAARAYSGGR